MFKITTIFVLACCVLVPAPAVFAAEKQACSLPGKLVDQIERKTANSHIIGIDDLDEDDRQRFKADHGDHCPGAVRVDFFSDGKPTYAVVLMTSTPRNKKSELLIAHLIGAVWNIRTLDSTTGIPVVWSERPGKYTDISSGKVFSTTRPVVVLAAYESWSAVYFWNGRSVKKIQITD